MEPILLQSRKLLNPTTTDTSGKHQRSQFTLQKSSNEVIHIGFSYYFQETGGRHPNALPQNSPCPALIQLGRYDIRHIISHCDHCNTVYKAFMVVLLFLALFAAVMARKSMTYKSTLALSQRKVILTLCTYLELCRSLQISFRSMSSKTQFE